MSEARPEPHHGLELQLHPPHPAAPSRGFLCGAPDAQLAHSAQPAGGEKWVAQLWVRQHQLHAENKVSPLRPEDRPAVPDRVAGKAGTSATLLRRE